MAAALPMYQSLPPPPPGVALAVLPATTSSSAAVRTASLYVGDLHPDVTEVELQQMFGTVGPLLSVRLCRDRVTRSSLCYAYVNFLLPYDASRALSCLNHTKLRGKTMRIMWCQRDPLARKNGVANLYVKNLVPSVTSARLEEIFGEYGTILSCKVAEENGMNKGFGFVQFESDDSATTALSALNGTMLEGKQLYVCKFVRKNERKDASNETFTNLYFKNLDEDVTEDRLKEKFSDHGTVCNLVIMKDNEGKSKGFGFVNFSSHEEAKKAVQCLNGAPLGSKVLFVGRAQKKAERREILKHVHKNLHKNNPENSKDSNLFVKNLNVWLDKRDLELLFSPFGKVTSAKVVYNEDGVSKGFGFVRFSRPEEAKRALDSLNGTAVQGRVLYVALAQSREERRRHLQSCPVQYPKQPFHPSYWDILVPQYHPLYYNFPPPLQASPPFSMPHLSSFQLKLYENFRIGSSGVFPFQGQRHLEKLPDTSFFEKHLQVPRKQPQQEPNKDMAYRCHPQTSASSQGLKQQKPLIKQGNKSVKGAPESSTSGSGSGNPPTGSSLQWVYKNNFGKMFQPSATYIQTGHSTKRTEVLVEMDMQKLLNSQNPLAVPVEKAIKMIGASSGSQTCSYSSVNLAAA